jgi:hypothetical protein
MDAVKNANNPNYTENFSRKLWLSYSQLKKTYRSVIQRELDDLLARGQPSVDRENGFVRSWTKKLTKLLFEEMSKSHRHLQYREFKKQLAESVRQDIKVVFIDYKLKRRRPFHLLAWFNILLLACVLACQFAVIYNSV